jgi:hypothetical protein
MKALPLLFLLWLPIASAELPPDPIDTELEMVKPRPGDSVPTAAAKCVRLASRAEARGVKLLLLGIEGQGGFKADNAWLVYRYLWRITHGIPDRPPALDTAAPILHRLLLPLVDHFNGRVEVLDFPETAVTKKSGGVPEACVVAWMARRDSPRVALFGHSFGADAAWDLATILGGRGIPVEQVFSVDAVAKSPARRYTKPSAVRRWTNFFQQNEPPFGAFVRGAEKNRDLSSLGVNHRTIVRSPPVIAEVKSALGQETMGEKKKSPQKIPTPQRGGQ